MTYVKYTISIPEGMVPYLSSFDDPEEIFARDATLIENVLTRTAFIAKLYKLYKENPNLPEETSSYWC